MSSDSDSEQDLESKLYSDLTRTRISNKVAARIKKKAETSARFTYSQPHKINVLNHNIKICDYSEDTSNKNSRIPEIVLENRSAETSRSSSNLQNSSNVPRNDSNQPSSEAQCSIPRTNNDYTADRSWENRGFCDQPECLRCFPDPQNSSHLSTPRNNNDLIHNRSQNTRVDREPNRSAYFPDPQLFSNARTSRNNINLPNFESQSSISSTDNEFIDDESWVTRGFCRQPDRLRCFLNPQDSSDARGPRNNSNRPNEETQSSTVPRTKNNSNADQSFKASGSNSDVIHQKRSSELKSYTLIRGSKKIQSNSGCQTDDIPKNYDNCTVDPFMCDVCALNRKDTALHPCGHVLCSKCTMKLTCCPSCRRLIEYGIKIYL